MAQKRGNHEGTIYQLSSGKLRAQVTIHGRRFSFTASTRKECQKWLSETTRHLGDGMNRAAANETLADFLHHWLVVKKTKVRTATFVQYNQIIRDYVVPHIGMIRVVDLRTDHIQRLYQHLLELKVSVSVVRKTHTILHSALQQALRTDLIFRNPVSTAQPPSLPPTEISFMDDSQASQFLIAIRGHRWEALFHLALTSGARQKELLGLKWTDFDWAKKTLKIDRQLGYPGDGIGFSQTKTRNSRRTISLGSQTIQVLRQHYDRQCKARLEAGENWQEFGLIFTTSNGTPIHPRNLLKEFKKILKQAGLPPIRFHDLRHTCASLLLNDNVSPIVVARRLGHSKPSTTMDIYGHLIPDMQTEAAEKLDRLITPIPLDSGTTEDSNSEPVALHGIENYPRLPTK